MAVILAKETETAKPSTGIRLLGTYWNARPKYKNNDDDDDDGGGGGGGGGGARADENMGVKNWYKNFKKNYCEKSLVYFSSESHKCQPTPRSPRQQFKNLRVTSTESAVTM